MLDIRLSPQSERFSIPLTLPASRYDMLDACSRLSVTNLTEARIHIPSDNDMPHLVTPLRIAVTKMASFEELDFFAARLNALTSQERFLMDGLCYIHGPETIKDLINMTYNLDNVMVAGDIETSRQLGAFLVENGFMDFPEEVIPYLDFAKIGTEHLAGNTCAIVDGVYFEDNRSIQEVKTVYDGVTLPEQGEGDHVFFVRIGNPEHDPNDSLFAELNLPATDEEMTDALEFIGVSFPFNVVIDKFESRIAAFAGIEGEYTDLSALNDLADQIDRMTDEDYVKYKAVLEYEELLPVQGVIDRGIMLQKLCGYSYQLEQYSFFPQYHDAESYGQYMIGFYDIPERIKPYVNLREYGQSLFDESNMTVGSYGVIRPEYEQKHTFTTEPEPEQGQQMGGM